MDGLVVEKDDDDKDSSEIYLNGHWRYEPNRNFMSVFGINKQVEGKFHKELGIS